MWELKATTLGTHVSNQGSFKETLFPLFQNIAYILNLEDSFEPNPIFDWFIKKKAEIWQRDKRQVDVKNVYVKFLLCACFSFFLFFFVCLVEMNEKNSLSFNQFCNPSPDRHFTTSG